MRLSYTFICFHNLSVLDLCSQAILYSASALVAQALRYDIDRPQMAYTILADGQLWRVVVSVNLLRTRQISYR
jgi:hypothetical protein